MSKLVLTLANKNIAYKLYMPFINGGGIFIPTQEEYQLGDQIALKVHLTELEQALSFVGQVIWLSMPGIYARSGVGVQLQGQKGEAAKQQMENYIAGMDHTKPTFTL